MVLKTPNETFLIITRYHIRFDGHADLEPGADSAEDLAAELEPSLDLRDDAAKIRAENELADLRQTLAQHIEPDILEYSRRHPR